MMKELLQKKNISIYKLSKLSGIPYSTCNDIVNERIQIKKCTSETVYNLSKALDVSMEDIIAPYLFERCSFETFKSAICHRLKEMGDIDFIIDVLESDDIRTYFNRKWYLESLYLLAMLDYICRINNVSICSDYNDIRKHRLEKIVYPSSLIALSLGSFDDAELKMRCKHLFQSLCDSISLKTR